MPLSTEKLAHITLIAVSLASLGLLVDARLHRAPDSGKKQDPNYLVGKRIDVNGMHWGGASTNLVLFINSHCRFCGESAGFYQELTANLRQRKPGIAIAALSIEPPSVLSNYLAERGIAGATVLQAPPNFVLKETPTLLLVDASGVVRHVFIGKLGDDEQAAVFKALGIES